MKVLRFLVLAVTMLVMTSEARATIETRHLAKACASIDAGLMGFCDGYLWAAVDAQELYSRLYNVPKEFCMREGIDTEQLRKIYLSWVNGRPDVLDVYATATIPMALRQVLPCR